MGLLSPSVLGGNPSFTLQDDLIIQNKLYPGVILNPLDSELGGLFSVLREIVGSQWLMQNADMGGMGFFLKDITQSGVAFRQIAGGGFAQYSVPAGTLPGFTWIRKFYVDATGTIVTGGGGGGGGGGGVATTTTQVTAQVPVNAGGFTRILAANPARLGFVISNDTLNTGTGGPVGNTVMGLAFGEQPAAGFQGCNVKLDSGGEPYEHPGDSGVLWTGDIYAILNPGEASGLGNGAQVTEWRP